MDNMIQDLLVIFGYIIKGILYIIAFPFMIMLTPLMIGWKVFKWVWFGSKLF